METMRRSIIVAIIAMAKRRLEEIVILIWNFWYPSEPDLHIYIICTNESK